LTALEARQFWIRNTVGLLRLAAKAINLVTMRLYFAGMTSSRATRFGLRRARMLRRIARDIAFGRRLNDSQQEIIKNAR